MLPYRTVLRLPSKSDVVQLAEQEVQTWLTTKLDRSHLPALRAGDYFAPGIHNLGTGKELRVARQERADGSRGLLLRLTESTPNGSYEVCVTAIDNVEHQHRQDSLLIEALRLDATPRGFQVDPPRLVKQLLAREDVYDGDTPVTASPRLVRVDDEDEVFNAIVDPQRSVSVILAASVGRAHDEDLRRRVADLTRNTVGVAAVFVADEQLVEKLGERLPASHTLEQGRVRTYLSGVDLLDPVDGRRHRVLGPETFARAIRGTRVSPQLKAAFAAETRAPLLDRPLPNDVRRASNGLRADLAMFDRDAKINERTKSTLSRTPAAPVAKVEGTGPGPQPLRATMPSGEPEPTDRSITKLVKGLITRWLKRDVPVSPDSLNELDTYIARAEATAETLFEDAGRLESALQTAREAAETIKADRDELELELAEVQDESSTLRRRVEYLQGRLRDAGDAEAYTEPTTDEAWREPAGLVELATILMSGASARHIAFERVEFTGDLSVVEDLQKRDQIGRYSNALWQYVQVLFDYVGQRREGYQGSVHSYLTDSRVSGRKCSPQRHAATESATVLSNPVWSAERMFPVPSDVDGSKRILMDAHFKPTHKDTVAPRMHYYDDTAGPTGKVYIGYIGRHLTNTKTKNA